MHPHIIDDVISQGSKSPHGEMILLSSSGPHRRDTYQYPSTLPPRVPDTVSPAASNHRRTTDRTPSSPQASSQAEGTDDLQERRIEPLCLTSQGEDVAAATAGCVVSLLVRSCVCYCFVYVPSDCVKAVWTGECHASNRDFEFLTHYWPSSFSSDGSLHPHVTQ